MLYVILMVVYIVIGIFLSIQRENLIGFEKSVKPTPAVMVINFVIYLLLGAIIWSTWLDDIYWRVGLIAFSVMINIRFRIIKKILYKMGVLTNKSTIDCWNKREILINLFTFSLSFLTLLTFLK